MVEGVCPRPKPRPYHTRGERARAPSGFKIKIKKPLTVGDATGYTTDSTPHTRNTTP